MNPRELLARLNVPAIRYSIGRGGIPDLVNIDVAGALGMAACRKMDDGTYVPDADMAFARQVFEACWWEDGAPRQDSETAREALRRVMEERNRRERMVLIARLELNIAECVLAGKRRPTDYDRQILEDCTGAVERAKAHTWPWEQRVRGSRAGREGEDHGPPSPVVYSRMYRAAVNEIRNPRHCPECRGRGEVQSGALKKICAECVGTGVKAEKKKERATALGVDFEQYRRMWFKVYEWSFRMIREAETNGAVAFAQAVSTMDSEAAA